MSCSLSQSECLEDGSVSSNNHSTVVKAVLIDNQYLTNSSKQTNLTSTNMALRIQVISPQILTLIFRD